MIMLLLPSRHRLPSNHLHYNCRLVKDETYYLNSSAPIIGTLQLSRGTTTMYVDCDM